MCAGMRGSLPLALGALVLLLLVGCSGLQLSKKDPVEVGKKLYGENCILCHGDAATGEGSIPTAPPHGRQGHTWHHADSQLKGIILGKIDYPGRTMPSFGGILTDEEVNAILAYLKSGWTPEQVRAQRSRR